MKLMLWLAAGLALGPSFLNAPLHQSLSLLSQVSAVGFLFLAGFEMRFPDLRRDLKFFASMFVGAFFVPVAIGYLFFSGNLFLSTAMGISALPVAIQILREKKRMNSDFARRALTIACLCDIAAWIAMAFIFPKESAGVWISSHLIVFAFFTGLVTGQVMIRIRARFSRVFDFVQSWIFSPLFFIGLGWKIPILSLFNTSIFVTIFFAALVSKGAGVFVTAKMNGESTSSSFEFAALLNARGAMEIIAANFAFSLGLIDGAQFAGLVVVGVLTSLLAWPLVRPSEGAS